MKEKIEQVLEEVRPILRAEGGDVQLVEVGESGVVKVRFSGFCDTCQDSLMSMKQGLERLLRERVPDLRELILV